MAMDLNARVTNVTTHNDFDQMATTIKASVNGVLAHELSVGDAGFIRPENKIVIPFLPNEQLAYSLIAGAKVDDAKLLTVARMGLLSYWKTELTGVDKDEQVAHDIVDTLYDSVAAAGSTTFTAKMNAALNGLRAQVVLRDADLVEEFKNLDNMGNHAGSGVPYLMIFLHMKDIGMLVAANLVRTGHHYQKNTNGAFKALERKRFGREVFAESDRGILYHEAMHCFLQTSKHLIYSKYLTQLANNNLSEPFTLLDAVVTRRIPVVPAGGAWLSAGITIMNEVLSIPKVADKVSKEYKELVVEANQALKAVIAAGKVDPGVLSKYEGMAAYAHGILSEIAPNHSAVNAPSLSKLAEQHIGAKSAGSDLGRKVLRSD